MEGSSGPSWSPANPAPLGLAGFAMTTFILSMVNSKLVGTAALGGMVPLALVYGGVAQLLAGMWEFRTGNTFGAVAFTSFGAFWLSVYFGAGTLTGHANALFLWSWAIFTVYMTVAAIRVSGSVLLVFVLLSITFILLAIGNMGGGHSSIVQAGGYVGIATAIAAWYASFGAVVNSTFGKEVVPLFPAKQ